MCAHNCSKYVPMPNISQMLANLSNLQTPGRIVMLSSGRLTSVSLRYLLSLLITELHRFSPRATADISVGFKCRLTLLILVIINDSRSLLSYRRLPILLLTSLPLRHLLFLFFFPGSLLIHPLKIRPLNPKLRRFRLNHILLLLITEVSHLLDFCLILHKCKRQFRTTRHVPRPGTILQLIILIF